MSIVDRIIELWNERGHSQYGDEAVTQLEHALQTAQLAEREHANDSLVVAALLHDVGHLLHDLPADAPVAGIDDRHETAGHNWLKRHFGPEVTEPVRLHVAAKRYLCTATPEYAAALSVPSQVSLRLQGGTMTEEETEAFRKSPFADDAIRLRHWDDAAKIVGEATPSIEHYRDRLETACLY